MSFKIEFLLEPLIALLVFRATTATDAIPLNAAKVFTLAFIVVLVIRLNLSFFANIDFFLVKSKHFFEKTIELINIKLPVESTSKCNIRFFL